MQIFHAVILPGRAPRERSVAANSKLRGRSDGQFRNGGCLHGRNRSNAVRNAAGHGDGCAADVVKLRLTGFSRAGIAAKPPCLTGNNKGTMFSLCSQIVGCNHGPVSFGRSGRAGLFEPVSRNRRGMGAGPWDALAHSQPYRGCGAGIRLRVHAAVKRAAPIAPVIHKSAHLSCRPMDSGICDPAWLIGRESQSPF